VGVVLTWWAAKTLVRLLCALVVVLAGAGAVVRYDFADRSTVTAARAKPPTAKTAVSGANSSLPTKNVVSLESRRAVRRLRLLQRCPLTAVTVPGPVVYAPHGTCTGQNHTCERIY
jgi:hypothetical protein